MRTATKTSLACQLCWERPLWVLMWVGTWPQPAGMGPMQVTAREASARSLLGRATAEAIGPSGTPRLTAQPMIRVCHSRSGTVPMPGYVCVVTAAANEAVQQRFLLASD